MESPKPQEADKKEKQPGCTGLLIRAAIGIVIVLAVDYLVTWIFRAAYPPDEITAALVPFQNGYLAATDAFITSEGSISEFTDDPGGTSRFLGLALLAFIAVFIIAVAVSFIPFLKKLIDYTLHFWGFCALLLMAHSLFYPPTMTVFDRERKVMIIHKPEWMFFGTKTEIPFGQITGFSYEEHETDGNDHVDQVQYADLFAETTNGKIFIGENQVGSHPDATGVVPMLKVRKRECEQAVEALNLLIGKYAHPF